MLRFVHDSPVGEWLGGGLEETTATGAAELKLALALPLYDMDAATVKGRLALAGNDVRLGSGIPLLGGAAARIDFTQEGFAITDGTAQVLGGEARFEGGMQPDGAMRFTARGSATADGLRRAEELGVLAKAAGSMRGRTSYRLALGLVRGHTEFELTSDLAGLALDLPAPLNKTADAALPLRIAATLEPTPPGAPAQDRLRVQLGPVLQAEYLRALDGAAPRVLRG